MLLFLQRFKLRCNKLHTNISDEDFELGYSFVIFGCIGLLRTWLNSDRHVTADRLAHVADLLLRRGALSLTEQPK